MTKEEALNKIIEYYKNGSKTPVSDFCRIPCSVCPFVGDYCEHDIADILIERLLKAEEHQETNLEHYRGNVAFDKTNGIVLINLINGWKNNYSCLHEDAIDWLLSPYEEPKPKYKLSKFEYDLLDSYCDTTQRIKELWTLKNMQDKGYFKGIPTDIPIRDILDNCEVTDE